MYRLHIKGNLEQTQEALKQHGMVADYTEATKLPNETIAIVDGCHYSAIVEWFTEKAEVIPSIGYPVGSLLFYSIL